MAYLTISDVFGQGAYVDSSNSGGVDTLVIDLRNFQDVDNGGEMPTGTGWYSPDGLEAEQILAAILIRLRNKLPATINGDPEQAVFVAEGGKAFATGARNGQVKKSYTVSFFINAHVGDNIAAYQFGGLPNYTPPLPTGGN